MYKYIEITNLQQFEKLIELMENYPEAGRSRYLEAAIIKLRKHMKRFKHDESIKHTSTSVFLFKQ